MCVQFAKTNSSPLLLVFYTINIAAMENQKDHTEPRKEFGSNLTGTAIHGKPGHERDVITEDNFVPHKHLPEEDAPDAESASKHQHTEADHQTAEQTGEKGGN